MQCPTCPDSTVTAFCRDCGKGICRQCAVDRQGVPYCPECAEPEPAQLLSASSEPPPSPPSSSSSSVDVLPDLGETPPPLPPAPFKTPAENPTAPHPGLAGVLGVVPGLGAVYNGQYAKGVLHALMFGMLIAIASSTPIGPAFAPVVLVFFLYMPIEAYRTATALRRGETVDEMSGLVGAIFQPNTRSPVGGVVIIALGVLLLLFTLGVFNLKDVAPYWPILLIVLGVWQLFRAVRTRAEEPPPGGYQAADHEEGA